MTNEELVEENKHLKDLISKAIDAGDAEWHLGSTLLHEMLEAINNNVSGEQQ